MKRIVEDARSRCTKLLSDNIEALHRIAEALIERETISGDDLNLLIEGKPLPAAEPSRPAGQPGQSGKPSQPGKPGASDFSFEVQGEVQDEARDAAGNGDDAKPQGPQGPRS